MVGISSQVILKTYSQRKNSFEYGIGDIVFNKHANHKSDY